MHIKDMGLHLRMQREGTLHDSPPLPCDVLGCFWADQEETALACYTKAVHRPPSSSLALVEST